MRKFGTFALLRLLIRALATHSAHQAAQVVELKRLNHLIEERFPPRPTGKIDLYVQAPADDLLLDPFVADPAFLSHAEEARERFRQEYSREPEPEELWDYLQQERKDRSQQPQRPSPQQQRGHRV